MKNVFVSYSHRLDQVEADNFRTKFNLDRNVFSDRSLENRDIGHLESTTIRDNYIKPKIRNSSVTIILIGKETGGRWWCDWEIYYSLLKTANNDRNALLGIRLPNKQHWVPSRLENNLHMGKIIDMPRDYRTLSNEIDNVFALRGNSPDLSINLRQRNSYIST
ncbi:MAG: TIR domain-containing protein [Saprospiraceae bacterium]|nr:TIR domain-containing protein [Saprospiraceae bacterium]